MKLMAGELKETGGYVHSFLFAFGPLFNIFQIERNRKARIARFSQHSLEQLNPELTPVEYLDSIFKVGSEHTMRQHLGRFGITGNLAMNKIGRFLGLDVKLRIVTYYWAEVLSGGQKSRVVLAELSWAHPHILFLDEPSNHLDIDAIEALAQGIKAFPGMRFPIFNSRNLI